MMMKEMDIGGIFITPILGWALFALLTTWGVTRLLARFGFYRWVWHRHLFDIGLYVILFAAMTFVISPR
jgi:hypothetical protein